MKQNAAVAFGLLALVMAIMVGWTTADETSTVATSALPATLDELYPPRAQGPMYLIAMHELNSSLSGMVCDLFEDDMENALRNLERFKSEYVRVANLVPEWQSRYPEGPLDALDTAMSGGNRDQVMAALGQIDMVCHNCHVELMPAVHFKYHWGEFKSINVTDPLTNEEVGYKQFKLMLNTDLLGIGNDLAQGQVENAQKHMASFKSRFKAMSGLCEACHDAAPKYFVSDDILARIDTLQRLVDNAPADQAQVGGLAQAIGMESCSKSHLVHVPGAYSKY